MPTLADGNLPFRVGLLHHLAGDRGAPAVDAGTSGVILSDRDWKGLAMKYPRGLRRLVCRATAVAATCIGVAGLSVPSAPAAAPTDCTIAPRPASEFVLPTDPYAGANVGRLFRIVEDESELPAGTSAASADVAAAQTFADLYTACQNAGDMGQIAALYSEAMFQDSLAARLPVRLPPENPLQELLLFLLNTTARDRVEATAYLAEDLAAPRPLSPPIADTEVRDVRVLPDGRLCAVLIQDGRPTEFQVYARVDGRLLLDERWDFR
jgi:hypothetical protein